MTIISICCVLLRRLCTNCLCLLSTLCGRWDVSSPYFWGHLAAMEGTACGVLPLCVKRTRALSYCARHQWVWIVSFWSNPFFVGDVISCFFICQSVRLPRPHRPCLCVSFQLHVTSNLLLWPQMIIFFLSTSWPQESQVLSYSCASKCRAIGLSCFSIGSSLVWDCLKYSCQTSRGAHVPPIDEFCEARSPHLQTNYNHIIQLAKLHHLWAHTTGNERGAVILNTRL